MLPIKFACAKPRSGQIILEPETCTINEQFRKYATESSVDQFQFCSAFCKPVHEGVGSDCETLTDEEAGYFFNFLNILKLFIRFCSRDGPKVVFSKYVSGYSETTSALVIVESLVRKWKSNLKARPPLSKLRGQQYVNTFSWSFFDSS